MPIPSVKTLRLIAGDRASELRKLLDGRSDPDTYESVSKWRAQCFNEPHHDEKVMCAADEILGTHGVEALRCDGWHGHYHAEIHATYCNTGDAYGPTLILESETGRYLVSSWGDYVEATERRRNDCRFP